MRPRHMPGPQPAREALLPDALAHDARERALGARQAAQRATTEYARRAHNRSAELHDQLALSHEDSARRLRSGDGRDV